MQCPKPESVVAIVERICDLGHETAFPGSAAGRRCWQRGQRLRTDFSLDVHLRFAIHLGTLQRDTLWNKHGLWESATLLLNLTSTSHIGTSASAGTRTSVCEPSASHLK